MKLKALALATGAAALAVSVAGTALAKVEGDTIILGSSISLTGKYATTVCVCRPFCGIFVREIDEPCCITQLLLYDVLVP